jgi:myo-inositol-1(or 4)-monophosphatase
MYEELLETALEAAAAAARGLRGAFRSGGLEVEQKDKHDFVTSADRNAERAIVELLRQRWPDHAVLTEETGVLAGTSDYLWVIDPLDGTTNFLRGLPMYAVSIACCYGGDTVLAVVHNPERGDTFTATRGAGASLNGTPIRVSDRDGLSGAFLATGYPFKARAALDVYLAIFHDVFLRASAIRRCGSAALDLAYTASGVFDGFFEFRLSPWDVAAGALLIQEAGGTVSDLDGGTDFATGGNVLAGPESLWRELLSVVSAHADEVLLDRLVPQATAPAESSC